MGIRFQKNCEDDPLLAPNVDQSTVWLILWVIQLGLQTDTEKGSIIERATQVVDGLSMHRVHSRIWNMIESWIRLCDRAVNGIRWAHSVAGLMTKIQ